MSEAQPGPTWRDGYTTAVNGNAVTYFPHLKIIIIIFWKLLENHLKWIGTQKKIKKSYLMKKVNLSTKIQVLKF